MPELPEVETTRRGVAPWCQGEVVEALVVREPRL
ncbi:MAG: DNA-formamidopyrimidine glycosylase, partial [Gammaproteobacteria bacterium]|nr:DNA-formamidopyrimidine glycosylase [Gammaproteobacteria bacterium]